MKRYHHLNPENQKTQDRLSAALRGASPAIISSSADGSRMVIRASYTDHPDQFFLYDKAAKRLDLIAKTYSEIDGKFVAEKERFDYRTSDGFNIRGYLTYPIDSSKKNLPLIVLPHGGPEGRDDQSFDWWAFFYAANGYVVYQPNFRGSDGYGYDFRAAGYGEWGRKMQDDITDGVGKLIADGIADKDRICIVGASYGGYAALAGATLTPELYACAVSVNGVSDLPSMLGFESKSSEIASDYWKVRIGDRFRNAEELRAVSPADNANAVTAPILIMHGEDDTVVPLSQSRGMSSALKRADKPHKFIRMKGEDHWLSGGASRTQMLDESLKFVNEHIGE